MSNTVVTSTGYTLDIPWDGQFRNAQIYYTGASCTGDAYLNDGGTNGQTISGKWAVYSGSMNTLMAPATTANGVATSGGLTSAAIDNPACGTSSGTKSGWKLTPLSRSAAGLPNTITLPLRLG